MSLTRQPSLTVVLIALLGKSILLQNLAQAASHRQLSAPLDKTFSKHVVDWRIDDAGIAEDAAFGEYRSMLDQTTPNKLRGRDERPGKAGVAYSPQARGAPGALHRRRRRLTL